MLAEKPSISKERVLIFGLHLFFAIRIPFAHYIKASVIDS